MLPDFLRLLADGLTLAQVASAFHVGKRMLAQLVSEHEARQARPMPEPMPTAPDVPDATDEAEHESPDDAPEVTSHDDPDWGMVPAPGYRRDGCVRYAECLGTFARLFPRAEESRCVRACSRYEAADAEPIDGWQRPRPQCLEVGW